MNSSAQGYARPMPQQFPQPFPRDGHIPNNQHAMDGHRNDNPAMQYPPNMRGRTSSFIGASKPEKTKASQREIFQLYKFEKMDIPGREASWEMAKWAFVWVPEAEWKKRVKKPASGFDITKLNAPNMDGFKRRLVNELLEALRFRYPEIEADVASVELSEKKLDRKTGKVVRANMNVIAKITARDGLAVHPDLWRHLHEVGLDDTEIHQTPAVRLAAAFPSPGQQQQHWQHGMQGPYGFMPPPQNVEPQRPTAAVTPRDQQMRNGDQNAQGNAPSKGNGNQKAQDNDPAKGKANSKAQDSSDRRDTKAQGKGGSSTADDKSRKPYSNEKGSKGTESATASKIIQIKKADSDSCSSAESDDFSDADSNGTIFTLPSTSSGKSRSEPKYSNKGKDGRQSNNSRSGSFTGPISNGSLRMGKGSKAKSGSLSPHREHSRAAKIDALNETVSIEPGSSRHRRESSCSHRRPFPSHSRSGSCDDDYEARGSASPVMSCNDGYRPRYHESATTATGRRDSVYSSRPRITKRLDELALQKLRAEKWNDFEVQKLKAENELLKLQVMEKDWDRAQKHRYRGEAVVVDDERDMYDAFDEDEFTWVEKSGRTGR